MATTPQPIQAAIGIAATTLYTAFVAGGATRAMMVSLDLTNTTTSDITVDVYWLDDGGANAKYFADDLVVPAKGTASWRGIQVLDAASETIKAIASAVGVDATGCVLENI
jgi:hypothetical protein